MKYYRIKVAGIWCDEVYAEYESAELGKGYATLDLFTFARKGIVQEVKEVVSKEYCTRYK